MSFQRIMGLEITDDNLYQQYRDNMTPLLELYGGSFGYDFKVAEVLKTKTEQPINRVFTIDFPSEEVMNSFFNDEKYLAIKAQFFECSVGAVTTIALHETSE